MSARWVIQTERLGLREMTAADIDDMARMLGDPLVMRYYERPYTRDEAAEWIDKSIRLYADKGYGMWAVHRLDTGEFVGDCGLTLQEVEDMTELEVGYHLLPGQWGHGYATEAAIASRDFAQRIGNERLVAIIAPDNTPSIRVAERVGMTFERTFQRRGIPRSLYSMVLAELGGDPV
jgi:RimJ/RimL family protein N-acetyltransferase